MKDLIGLFDEYTLKARFLPACLAGLPLLALIASYFDWNKFLISNVIVGALIGFVMIFLLSNFSRYMGKKVEKKLLEEWGVFPTTQLLRHVDTTLNKEKKKKIHELLTEKSSINLPSEQDEIDDPDKADYLYNEVIVWLRGETRDEKILLNENITYGFVRNSLGLKPIALVICVISIIILIILFFLNYQHSLRELGEFIIFIKKIKLALWLTLAISLLMPLYWIFFINKSNIRSIAIDYAKTLIDLSYHVKKN